MAGAPLARWYPDHPKARGALLCAATELHTPELIELFAQSVRELAMANPTGWKPSMEQAAKDGGAAPDAVGLGGATRGIAYEEPLVFETDRAAAAASSLPARPDAPRTTSRRRCSARGGDGMPGLSELEVVRHFTRLSAWNHGIDTGFYPLGSCTMKYNPKSSEAMARLPGFADAAPARRRPSSRRARSS